MQEMKSFMATVKSRGQMTIPKKIREASHFEEGQRVSMIPVGDAVIVMPQQLTLDEARRQLRKILKASGISIEELLAGLKEERVLFYKETYRKNGL